MSKTLRRGIDILHLLRERQRVTPLEAAAALELDEDIARENLRILAERGIARNLGVAEREGRPGTKPRVYGLAKEWGGQW